MACDSLNRKAYICNLSSESGQSRCNRDTDYSFSVVNIDDFNVEIIVDLFDLVTSICPKSIGICGIAYNSSLRRTYVLTRRPQRYVIELDEHFAYLNHFYVCDASDDVVYGDIASFDNFILTCYWNNRESYYSNVVTFYDMQGSMVKTIELYGVSHIESIDFFHDMLIANFNDFSDGIETRIYGINLIQNYTKTEE